MQRRGAAAELFDVSWFNDQLRCGKVEPKVEPKVERSVVRLRPERPTIVLGSSLDVAVVDAEVAFDRGVDVVRRRSGGGAVWLDDSLVWFDVLVPRGDPLWDDDVQRAFLWLGESWATALRMAGVEGEIVVHNTTMRHAPFSDVVCFAGLGPGEVTLDGAKVVGISQRRTREYTLFQCGLLQKWNPQPLVELLEPGLVRSASKLGLKFDMRTITDLLLRSCVGVGNDSVIEAFLSGLPPFDQ
jgi:lipoate---protein ligase